MNIGDTWPCHLLAGTIVRENNNLITIEGDIYVVATILKAWCYFSNLLPKSYFKNHCIITFDSDQKKRLYSKPSSFVS